jgi:hypothetical protein
MILRVEGGLHNHWASFGLTATKGSPLALNARVRLTAGDLVQLVRSAAGEVIFRRTICDSTLVWAHTIAWTRSRCFGLREKRKCRPTCLPIGITLCAKDRA